MLQRNLYQKKGTTIHYFSYSIILLNIHHEFPENKTINDTIQIISLHRKYRQKNTQEETNNIYFSKLIFCMEDDLRDNKRYVKYTFDYSVGCFDTPSTKLNNYTIQYIKYFHSFIRVN